MRVAGPSASSSDLQPVLGRIPSCAFVSFVVMRRSGEFPRLRILPGNVNCMIKVQEKTFAAIEEAEAENVVVEKGQLRADDDVKQAEGALAFGCRNLRSR